MDRHRIASWEHNGQQAVTAERAAAGPVVQYHVDMLATFVDHLRGELLLDVADRDGCGLQGDALLLQDRPGRGRVGVVAADDLVGLAVLVDPAAVRLLSRTPYHRRR